MSSFGAKDWRHATLMIKVPHKHFDLVVYTTRHFHFRRRDCVASIHERSWKQVWHSRVPWMKHPHCVLARLRWHWGLEHVRFRRMPWEAAGGHQICTDIQRFYWFDWHLLTHPVARGRAKKQIQCPRADLISVKARAAIGHVPFFNFSMDWFKGKFTGNPHIWWQKPWFPVDFPLNQSIEFRFCKLCCFSNTKFRKPKESKSILLKCASLCHHASPNLSNLSSTFALEPLNFSTYVTTHVAELASCLQPHVFSTHFIFHDILEHLCPNSPSKCFNFRRSGQGWCMSTLLQI